MQFKDDFIILFSTEQYKDARLLEKLIINMSFSVSIYNLEQFRFKCKKIIYETNRILIFVTNPIDYSNYKSIKNIISSHFNNHLFIVKSNIVLNQKINTNEIYCSEIIGNDKFAKKIFELISKSRIAINNSNKEKAISLYEKTISIYAEENFASNYFELWRSNLPIEQLNFFSNLIPKYSIVLDAGCGPGHHTIYLGQIGFNMVGIDLSLAAINIAKSFSNNKTKFYCCNMLCTNFNDETYNGIWSCASIIHLPHHFLREQFKEFYRLLKPMGILALTIGINKKKYLDKFGRLFESIEYSEIEIILLEIGFLIKFLDNNITWNSTQGELGLSNWLTIYAEKKDTHNII